MTASNKKRKAVLITGEYRTFDIAIKGMNFIYEDDVDVYFSTWDQTRIRLETLNIDINELVTIERIQNTIGNKILSGCSVADHTTYDYPAKYNCKMINRWQTGLKMIRDSGIDYSVVMITRPDIYFNLDFPGGFHNLNDLETIEDDVVYIGWYHNNPEKKLDDMVIASRPGLLFEELLNINIDEWNVSGFADWHKWFWKYFEDRQTKIKKIIPHIQIELCRATCKPDDDTYDKIRYAGRVWRYALIDYQSRWQSSDDIKRVWHEGIFEEIENFRKFGI